MFTVQKWQRIRLVSLIQCVNILYMTDQTSFLADFYALSMSALLEYAMSQRWI
jgi:hypothetical protein